MMWLPSGYLATGLSMQLKNGSFSGERTKDVKGTQKHTEVLLVSWVPSAFLARRLASANTEKKK